MSHFVFQAEDGIRDSVASRGLGDVYKRQVQRYGKGGSIAGAISIPTRHIHQTIEMANKADIKNCIALLKACLLNLDKYDWETR